MKFMFLILLISSCGEGLFNYDQIKGSLSISEDVIYQGSSISLKWEISNHSPSISCSIYDDEKIIFNNITPKGKETLNPTSPTTYTLKCGDTNASLTLDSKSISIIPTSSFKDITNLESISNFVDLQQLKKDIFERQGKNLITNDLSLLKNQIPLNPPKDISNAGLTHSIKLNLEKSSLYGLTLDHDLNEYERICRSNPPTSLVGAMFNNRIKTESEEKSHTFSDYVYLSEFIYFPARSPLDQSTYSYNIEPPTVSYIHKIETYTHASGSYQLNLEDIQQSNRSNVNFVSNLMAQPPKGYPLPKSKNGYRFDPKHNTCNLSRPMVTKQKFYSTYRDWCEDFLTKSDRLKICRSNEHFERWVNKTKTGHQKAALLKKFDYTYKWLVEGDRIDAYYEPVASKRVITGKGLINCSEHFRSLKDKFNITDKWEANFDRTQFFITDSAWPKCGGFRCKHKVQRTAENQLRFENIEPAKNFCIDRWKGKSISSYLDQLETTCRKEKTFIVAFNKHQENLKKNKFLANCSTDKLCSKLRNYLSKSLTILPSQNTANFLKKLENLPSNLRITKEESYISSTISKLTNLDENTKLDVHSINLMLEHTFSAFEEGQKFSQSAIAGALSNTQLSTKDRILDYIHSLSKIKELLSTKRIIWKKQPQYIRCNWTKAGLFKVFKI